MRNKNFKEVKETNVPASTQEFKVTFDELDMSNGLISVESLAGNLPLWVSRKYKIRTR